MSRNRFLPCVFILLCAYSASVIAQQREILEGREYYFGIPHCDIQNGESARGTPIQLWISSRVQTRVRITVPRTGEFLGQYVITPRKTFILPVPQGLMNTQSGIHDKGIYIVAEHPITATIYVSYRWSGEAFKVIPREQLGRVYYTLNLYQDRTERERPGQILITATSDNTKVAVTPKVELDDGTRGGQTRIYTLQAGQTLLLKAKIKPGYDQDFNTTDLTGTRISATHPVNVVSGHTKGAFPRYSATMLGTPANFMRNMLVDGMWPVEFLGKEYFSAPVMYLDRPRADFDPDSYGDLIRIVATEDNTRVLYRRKSDNTWQQIPQILRAGEWYNFLNMDEPCLYKSNKPILVGQYGKAWRSSNVNPAIEKGNEGQNPSRNGQGMLVVLTPREQWATYTTFHSPAGIDDFVMITFYTAYTDSILFDEIPLRSRFGSKIQQVYGSEFSYVVSQIGAGDHTIESLSPNAKFTAYVYGNWDRSKDGFAYGYPTGINFALACDDSITLEATQDCGNVTGVAIALPDTSSCAQLISVELNTDVSSNYLLELHPEQNASPRQMHFTLTVVDPRQPAVAEVIAMTRSGRTISRRFTYTPEILTSTPSRIDFGRVNIGATVERQITLHNPATIDCHVASINLKHRRPEFDIVSPNLPTTVAPGESISITVKATALQEYKAPVEDVVLVTLRCSRIEIPLRLQTGKGCIMVTDVNFPALPIGTESPSPLKCRITNTSAFATTIFGIDYPGKEDPYPTVRHFREDFANLNPPFVLEGGAFVEFNVWYTPQTAGTPNTLSVTVLTDAEKNCSDTISIWTGSGVDAGPIIIGHDFGVVRVLDRYNQQINGITGYEGKVQVGAIGTAGSAVQNPTITLEAIQLPNGVSNPDEAFKLDLRNLPTTLFAGENRHLPAQFTPSVTGEYKVKVIITGIFNGEQRTAFDFLSGVAVVPIQDSLGWGSDEPRSIGTVLTGTAHIYNRGTMSLTVSDLKIADDAAGAFRIDPNWYSSVLGDGPFIIQPGGEKDIPVIFTVRQSGLQTARIAVSCDLMPDEIKNPILYGVGVGTSSAEATSYDFGNVYKCNTKTSQQELYVRNTGRMRLRVVNVKPATSETSQFFALENAGQVIGTTIDPDQNSLPLRVSFSPPYVQNRERQPVRYESNATQTYAFDWELVDDNGSPLNLRSYVSGTGIDIVVTATTKPFNANAYTVDPYAYGIPFEVEFNILDRPTRIDDGRVTNFHAYVYYDPTELAPEASTDAIITTGTLCDGWHVRKAVINQPGEFEVELEEPTRTRPLQGVGSLFKFKMLPYFGPKTEIDLPCALDLVGSSCWVLVDTEPGKVFLPKVCAFNVRQIILSLDGFSIMDPHPNPSDGQVVIIRFSVGYEAPTHIQILNSLGEMVKSPVNVILKAGSYEVGVDMSDLPNGTYFVRMVSGHWTSPTKTVVLIK